jgi:imidazoleglycerol-phosphate dehydratase
MKGRRARLRRKTRETDITVAVNLDGKGDCRISTGMPFMDHMLELLGRHAMVDLEVDAKGDLAVDYHHTVEDIGITLGTALDKALGPRRGIRRYGWCILPMDDALSMAAVDLGGRPYLVFSMANKARRIRDFDLGLVEEFFRALVVQARMNLHIRQLHGREPHHAHESVFKAVARSLRMAASRDERDRRVPSSKGVI